VLIHLIAAARPNFMKIAPLYHALKSEEWAEPIIVHTGQHYDLNMSDAFFRDLCLPDPHIHLGVGSGTHAEQTGMVMMAYEKVLMETRPYLVVVVGDVNSTMAAALVAVKLGVKVAHLEAGLRSFDRTMPEEINRLVTDALADILWTPSPDADENLLREGVSPEKIHRVGNVMIDSLEMLREKIEKDDTYRAFGLRPGAYALVTLHRPSNVDNQENLSSICKGLTRIGKATPVIFPIHPRTRKKIGENGLWPSLMGAEGLILSDPLPYIRFMNLVFKCRFAITDSGGIQEETTYLGIPCLTLRENTERPITVSQGTNRLCSVKTLEDCADAVIASRERKPCNIDLWDGKTAERVVEAIKESLIFQHDANPIRYVR
jgi:UDP-N-acetylglucosamine 2-epimerase (non-hydrolysing)